MTVNVQEAKTRLSELLHRVQAGEAVVIARAGQPVARLEPVEPRSRDFTRPLLPGLPPFDDSEVFAPMTEQELAEWEQGHEGDPLNGGARE